MKNHFTICIDGYWAYENRCFMPKTSGIYFVYACDRTKEGRLCINQLLHVGESENVREGILNHEEEGDWKSYLEPGESLCFSCSSEPMNVALRQRIKAGYAKQHKPPTNKKDKDDFLFGLTHISSVGDTAFIKNFFTVFPNSMIVG